jgi:hypothetical protein
MPIMPITTICSLAGCGNNAKKGREAAYHPPFYLVQFGSDVISYNVHGTGLHGSLMSSLVVGLVDSQMLVVPDGMRGDW